MATFQDFSLIKKEAETIKKENKLDTISQAFIYAVLEKNIFNVELEDCITDGTKDYGIDAYYIDEENKRINVYQFKYIETYGKTRKSIKEKEINNMMATIDAIWNKNDTFLSDVNYRVKEAIKEIQKALGNGYTDTKIFFVTNFREPVNKTNKNRYCKTFLNKFRAHLEFCGMDEVCQLILKVRKVPKDTNIKLVGRNYFDFSKGQIRTVTGQVEAISLIKSLIDGQTGELDEGFLEENVRIYLRTKGKINKQIYETAKGENRYKFFAYNNGITAICNSLDFTPSADPTLKLKDFQIVNGGQTIHALYDIYKDKQLKQYLKDISLLIRIYELKEREIGQEIARYTNTQNPVKMRDIMANDDVQIKLEEEFKKMGYCYERKKNQYRGKINISKRIDAEKIGQTLLAFYLEKPGSSKNKKQEIFGDYYNEVFDPDKINTEYVLPPYLLYKRIESEVRNLQKRIKHLENNGEIEKIKEILKKERFMLYAHYYVLLTIKFLCEKNKEKMQINNINKLFKKYFKKAKGIIYQVIKEKESLPKFSVTYTFKSNDLVNEIKNKINL